MTISGPKRIAVVFLLPDCNMSCRFCITRDGFDILTPEAAGSLLDALAGMGFDNIILGGGEPLAWPFDILETAQYAHSLGMTVQVGTNGIALTPRLMQAPALDRFILPLESDDAAVHDGLRMARGGHHAVILDRLETLAGLGREVTLSTVVTQRNLAGLSRLADWISAYPQRGGRLHAWHLYRFLAQGRGGSRYAEQLGLPLGAYREACAALKTAYPRLPILLRPDMTRSRSVGFYWMEHGRIRASGPFGLPPEL